MTRQEVVFRAALSRFVLGAAALALLPLVYPRTGQHWWVFTSYLVIAGVEQVLIRKQIGGMVRSLVAGAIDVCVLTFLVHRLGSVATIMASFYFFAGILNALVVGLRVGVALACLNAAAYATIVWCEHFGLLPFAPDVPELARLGPPGFGQSLIASAMITIFLLTSTTIVGMLVTQLRGREKELTRANTLLEDLSQRDPLTNLYNRRFLFAQLEHELERVKRGHALAVLMLDLDGFKHVNDLQGHLRGDMLLQEIAGALAATTRVTDVAGRYGGDEFMVILPDTGESDARVVAERIAAAVREVGERFDAARPVTASVGIALATGGDAVAAFLRRADDNAYRAKQGGGNRVVA